MGSIDSIEKLGMRLNVSMRMRITPFKAIAAVVPSATADDDHALSEIERPGNATPGAFRDKQRFNLLFYKLQYRSLS